MPTPANKAITLQPTQPLDQPRVTKEGTTCKESDFHGSDKFGTIGTNELAAGAGPSKGDRGWGDLPPSQALTQPGNPFTIKE